MTAQNNVGLIPLVMSKMETVFVIALPSVIYALIAVSFSWFKELPNAAMLAASFILSPVYLVLFVEEKLGLNKLSSIIDEKRVATWPETLVVTVVLILFLWLLDMVLFKGNHTVLFRGFCASASIAVVCLVSFCVLMLIR